MAFENISIVCIDSIVYSPPSDSLMRATYPNWSGRSAMRNTSASSLSSIAHICLLFVGKLRTAWLRVQVLVSMRYQSTYPFIDVYIDIPLNGPLHSSIGNDEWWNNVEELVAGTSEGVEDGSVDDTSERALTVSAEGEGGNTLLWLGTC
jgi:hypothetical protein